MPPGSVVDTSAAAEMTLWSGTQYTRLRETCTAGSPAGSLGCAVVVSVTVTVGTGVAVTIRVSGTATSVACGSVVTGVVLSGGACWPSGFISTNTIAAIATAAAIRRPMTNPRPAPRRSA
ncbi:hypothetical protein ACFPRL_11470 [Pseudoclavibacter helvolus]